MTKGTKGLVIRKIALEIDLQKAWDIRKQVFVEEQQVDGSMEFEYEEESHHFLALMEGMAVGTARWRDSEKGIKLERFAVLQEARNLGVGGKLVEAVLADIPKGNRIYLHAQVPAIDFYSRYGFEKVGDKFEEAGIQHFTMELKSNA